MDFTKYFMRNTKNNAELCEGIEIIRKNSQGKIWLMGSFVYKNIASAMYGIPKPEVDLDFLVEHPVGSFSLPKGWSVETNRHGNPKFVNGEKKIDYVPLKSLYSINFRELEPTIDNFLIGTPFTIQSMIYDIEKQNVILSEQGLDALLRRVVQVQDPYLASYAAVKKGKTVNEMIQKKAEELQFEPIFL
jgi:hypothetical protein